MKPMSSSDGHEDRGGTHARPRATRIPTSSSDPNAARTVIAAYEAQAKMASARASQKPDAREHTIPTTRASRRS